MNFSSNMFKIIHSYHLQNWTFTKFTLNQSRPLLSMDGAKYYTHFYLRKSPEFSIISLEREPRYNSSKNMGLEVFFPL